MLHEVEGTAQHGVLEVGGRVEGGDRAGEVLADAEVPGAPGDLLTWADESATCSGGRLLAVVRVAEQVDFDGAGEVEAAFDGRVDQCCFVEFDHAVDFLGFVFVSSVARERVSASDNLET